MAYGHGLAGADTLRRTTYKEFPLGSVVRGSDNSALVYGQASGSISAGACDIDLSTGTITSGSGYTADAAFAASEYGYVRTQDLEGTTGDDVVLPFYAVSANAADAAVVRLVAPFACKITRIDTILIGGALLTGDATLTAAIAGTGVTGGVITVTQSGSAAGDKDTCSPSALNTCAAGDTITLTIGGTATGNRTLNGAVVLERV